MKALVGAFNQEKALVGAFSVIVKTGCGTDGSFYSTNEDLYCEDSGEDNLGYSDHDTAEDFSDREPEIVCGGAVAQIAGSRAGRGRGRGSRAWDLSVVILALCVAIIFGYYSVM